MPNNFYFDEGAQEGASTVYGFFEKPAQEGDSPRRLGSVRKGEQGAWVFTHASPDSLLEAEARQMLKKKLLELNHPMHNPRTIMVSGDPLPEYLWHAGQAGSRGPQPFFQLQRFVGNAAGEWLGTVLVQDGHDCYTWVGSEIRLSEHEIMIVDRKLAALNGKAPVDSPFEIDDSVEHTVTAGRETTFVFHRHPALNPKAIVLDHVPGVDDLVQLEGEPLGEGIPLDDLEAAEGKELDWGPFADDAPTTGGIPKSEGVPVTPDLLDVDERRRVRSQQDAYGDGDLTYKAMLRHVQPITPTYEAWLRLREVLHKLPGLAPAVRDQMLRDQLPDRLDCPKDPYVLPVELTQEYLWRCTVAREEKSSDRDLRVESLENEAHALRKDLQRAQRTADECTAHCEVVNKRNEDLHSANAKLTKDIALNEQLRIGAMQVTLNFQLQVQELEEKLRTANDALEKAHVRTSELQGLVESSQRELSQLQREHTRIGFQLMIAKAAQEKAELRFAQLMDRLEEVTSNA